LKRYWGKGIDIGRFFNYTGNVLANQNIRDFYEVELPFILPNEKFNNLNVYNVLGQKVMELKGGELLKGDGKNTNGHSLSTGVYLFKSKDEKYSGKLVLQEGGVIGCSFQGMVQGEDLMDIEYSYDAGT
jgi:hypothetical protein